MKQANNNEIDILLKALARGGRDTSSLSQSQPAFEDQVSAASNHLDADELNSYAEGVVPAASRARYTAHLADCDRCRGIVISLTQAAGAASRYEALDQRTKAGFWQKLTALFSPPVLRYAVPAVVLTAVLGISLLALRQQRQSDFVAQHQPSTSNTPSTSTARTESPQVDLRSEGTPAIQKAAASPAASESAREKENTADDRRLAKPSDVPAGTDVTSVPAKAAPKPEEDSSVAQARPTFAAEPPPAPLGSRPGVAAAEKSGELRKEQPAEREVPNRQQEEPKRDAYKNEVRDEDQTHGPSRGTASSVSRRRVDGLTAGGPRKDKKDSGSEVETRTVAGRRFRREGNTWIDTAYESPRATVVVSRGSERFRALAADEPALRSIAEQLDGVVIVVLRGRAYRIQ